MGNRYLLILGDSFTLGVITLIGFASHGELSLVSLPRMLTTFLPLLAGWFVAAPWLGLFKLQKQNYSFLWRVPLTMLLSAPLTSVLRAVILNESALPLFTLILGCSTTMALLIWRGIWELINRSNAVKSN
jgi:Protein of unknown function (DUF3054)